MDKNDKGKVETTDNFKEDQGQLNLKKNGTEIYECKGRIQDHYPIYIPQRLLLGEKITYKAHKIAVHGGVILTMAAIKENYRIPKLRQIANFGCNRFHATPFTTQQQGILSSDKQN